jgi:AcrR family transcriptional regulator
MEATDRRVQRTRKTLHQALMSLVLESPYDSITVQQVTDRANVGRSTFYTHFQDKDELLISGIHDLRAMLTAAQQQGKSSRPHENMIAFSRAMFEHADQYRKVYRALVTTHVWPHVRQRIQNVLADLIRRECVAELKRLQRSKSKLPPELFIHCVASTFMAVMTWWVDHNSPLSAEEIDDVFRTLVLPTARTVFA